MRMFLTLLLVLILSGDSFANIQRMHLQVLARKNAVSAADYSDIIFYHDCDDLDDANKSGGSATVNYDAGILDNSSSPILGSGSWDNNNDGFDDLNFAVSGNVDFESGRIGFWHEPQEQGSGRIFWTNNGDIIILYDSSPDSYQITYMGDVQQNKGSSSNGVATYIELKMEGASFSVYQDGSLIAGSTGSGTPNDTAIHFFSADGNAWDSYVDQVISSNDPDRDIYALRNITDFS